MFIWLWLIIFAYFLSGKVETKKIEHAIMNVSGFHSWKIKTMVFCTTITYMTTFIFTNNNGILNICFKSNQPEILFGCTYNIYVYSQEEFQAGYFYLISKMLCFQISGSLWFAACLDGLYFFHRTYKEQSSFPLGFHVSCFFRGFV